MSYAPVPPTQYLQSNPGADPRGLGFFRVLFDLRRPLTRAEYLVAYMALQLLLRAYYVAVMPSQQRGDLDILDLFLHASPWNAGEHRLVKFEFGGATVALHWLFISLAARRCLHARLPPLLGFLTFFPVLGDYLGLAFAIPPPAAQPARHEVQVAAEVGQGIMVVGGLLAQGGALRGAAYYMSEGFQSGASIALGIFEALVFYVLLRFGRAESNPMSTRQHAAAAIFSMGYLAFALLRPKSYAWYMIYFISSFGFVWWVFMALVAAATFANAFHDPIEPPPEKGWKR